MKKIIVTVLGLFCGGSILANGDEAYPVETKILKFDADNDQKADLIRYTFQKVDSRNAVVKVEIKPTQAKPLKFEMETYVNFEISNCLHGCIKIVNFDYGRWGEGETKYYRYIPQRKSWFLEKSDYDYPHFDQEDSVPTLERDSGSDDYDLSERIDGEIMPTFSKTPLKTLEQKSKKMTDKFAASLSIAYIQYYLKHFPLSKKTVTYYNNVAYYIGKYNNEIAIFLLKKIIDKFPQRTVAYINLGDAYFVYKDKQFLKMYQIYVKLMKKHQKEARIPKRIFTRIHKVSKEE